MNTGNGSDADMREIDAHRAALYALLARALSGPPDDDFLTTLRSLEGDDTALGLALAELAGAAAQPATEIEQEYSRLFYGMGQGGEVLPYASYYLTGNLHDRPLADLRGDMARLGIARAGDTTEPEDHIAILLEMMHGLILGGFGAGAADVGEQVRFYDAHLTTWASDFFEDLEAAESARFYAALARVGRAYLAVEADAFKMAA